MHLDSELCYRSLTARDARFDGQFFVGVTSTGIYCRPVCPARTPRQDRCRFFANAASAEHEGYRPCLRCRPELAPGRAPVDSVGRLAAAAVARIEAGALNEDGIDALAAELGIGSRQLRRAIEREYGVAPVELAQTQRLLLAKRLLTDTDVKVADVAFASGFSSLRRFNHLFRSRYGLSPTGLRRRQAPASAPGALRLKLAYRPPLDWDTLAGFLAGRGAPGVEYVDGRRYLRSVHIGACKGWFAAEPLAGESALRIDASLSLLPVLTVLLARLRHLFDLDANPQAVAEHLGRDPRLRESCLRNPGLRVPGAFDAFELALRAVLGQQVTVKAASTIYGRFARAFGEPLPEPYGLLTQTGPDPQRIAAAGIDQLAGLGIPGKRAETVRGLARAHCEGRLRLHPGADPEATQAQLVALPGIGPWTAQYVAMRVLRDPDGFPAADLGVLRALGVAKPGEALAIAEGWRPWRAYAVMHLWRSYSGG
ncbi:MAG: helix-turn-helix domain-containing protein [Nevskia sp.]|nr:helix-turn-helix domain-containing protein [Nevskia sp.]